VCLYKHECQMTYARPHVNRILKRHPLGKEFFIIRDLILRHKTPLSAILTWRKRPIPWDGQWWIMYANRIWQELNTQSAPWPPEVIRNRKLCAEEATKRTKVLLKQLDKSKESQLIATYMLEDPLTWVTKNHIRVFLAPIQTGEIPPEESPYYPVIKMFENYLKDCQKKF